MKAVSQSERSLIERTFELKSNSLHPTLTGVIVLKDILDVNN